MLFTLLVTLGICLLIYIVFIVRFVPIIKTMAISSAKNIATQTINNAAGKVLKQNKVSYDQIMTLERDQNGQVTAVKANTLQIDILKYEITNEALRELNNMNTSELGVPIGTIIGGELLSGFGPYINVTVKPLGNVQTEIDNQFTSTGINQTRQQVILKVRTVITVIVSNYTMATNVESNFVIADTVIVGSVPGSYTVVEEDAGDGTVGKIYTYGKSGGTSSK
jgi:sporulation protein YunB